MPPGFPNALTCLYLNLPVEPAFSSAGDGCVGKQYCEQCCPIGEEHPDVQQLSSTVGKPAYGQSSTGGET